MSLMKLMPIAALGVAGAVGTQALREGSEAVDKFQVAATQSVELKGIAQAVAMDYTESQKLPLDNLGQFLRENMRTADGQPPKRDPAIDPWETPYQIRQIDKGFEIVSAGPDKQHGTEDDLIHSYDLSGISTAPPVGGSTARAAQPSGRPGQPQQQQKASSNKPRRKRTSAEETEQRVIEFQKKQAERGSARAMFALAERYLYGEGVEYNPDIGMEWLRKAAAAGSKNAEEKLDSMAKGDGFSF